MSNIVGVAGVVVSAGWGSLNHGKPKVLESLLELEDYPMVVRSVETAHAAGLSPIIVVVNTSTGDQVKECLGRLKGKVEIHYVEQPWRLGAADAVSRATALLTYFGIEHFLVLYADMPLWQPETLKSLICGHLENNAQISIVSMSIVGEHPSALDAYGRVLYNKEGEIVGVVEPGDATEDQLEATTKVNPSLYVVKRSRWLMAAFHEIPPKPKKDNYSAEFNMPYLIAIAHKSKVKIFEMPFEDKRQALGVNTVAELKEVQREFLARRARE